MQLEHRHIATNGITLHVVQSGPVAGPVVILLHGFPEFWYGWRRQISALAAAGYRVIVPDQRGYNLSDKPRGVKAYNMNALADDVIGLIDAAGRDRVFLVGHDWGGVIAWWAARNYPERIEKLAILNAPHPSAYQRFVMTHPKQGLMSWYIGFFQLPLLPEALTRRSFWQSASPGRTPDAFTEEDLAMYREAMRQPRALHSMINYYRAAVRHPAKGRIRSPRITMPTLILWGNRDKYLATELAHESAALCDDSRVAMFDASHWLQHEEAERVNQMLIGFLK
jgi:epoxide hydrolase 4